MTDERQKDPQNSTMNDITHIGMLFVGGMHQAMHIAPLAQSLARTEDVRVTAFTGPDDAEALKMMLAGLARPSSSPIQVKRLSFSGKLGFIGRLAPKKLNKILRILALRAQFEGLDALIATERTSTILKRLPGSKPPRMIHFPHGAGDGGRGFDPRIRLFDYVLVAGSMVYERTLAMGLAGPDNCTIVGSIKLAALTGPDAQPVRSPFSDDKPIILYNPHFNTRLSSWKMAEAIVDRIVSDGRFNLILAPHARLFDMMGDAERAKWLERSGAPNLHIDMKSPRLSDMSYTRLADIYLGDISSQVYEFLHIPRPCVFVNAHGIHWNDDADYAMWLLGDVGASPDEIMDALSSALDRHSHYRSAQERKAAEVLGPTDQGVPDRAALEVIRFLKASSKATQD